jgi:predicted secreted protein
MKTSIGRKIVNQASEETKRKVRDIADTMVIQEKFKRLKSLLMFGENMTTSQKREAELLNDEIEAYLESDNTKRITRVTQSGIKLWRFRVHKNDTDTALKVLGKHYNTDYLEIA